MAAAEAYEEAQRLLGRLTEIVAGGDSDDYEELKSQ